MEDIHLTRPKGRRVPHDQAVTSVTLAFAPYDVVLPALVGVFRAQYGYALLEDVHDRKDVVMDRVRRAETQPNVIHLNSATILEPADAPGITVIEDWWGPDMEALGAVLPELRTFSIFSLWENVTVEKQAYCLRDGPTVVRKVSLDRNMTQTGWFWEVAGEVQPWEDKSRFGARALSRRCDRPLLFDYAHALGVDLQAALGSRRRIARGKLVRKISHLDTTPGLVPTQVGEEYRRAAIQAGYEGSDIHESFETQMHEAQEAQEEYASTIAMMKRIRRARSADALARIMAEFAPRPDHPLKSDNRSANWRLAMLHAYRAFPDDPGLGPLEESAVVETAEVRWGISSAELARMAAAMVGTEDTARHVRAYRKIIATAETPEDVLEGSAMFLGAAGRRFQPDFRVNAVREFLETAIRMDAKSGATGGLAKIHDRLQREAGQIGPCQTGDGQRILDRARARKG
jgi:hypothetical protein